MTECCFNVLNARPGDAGCADPDCIRCLRTKLRAVGAVVFFREQDGWRLDKFQGEKPYEDSEAEFQYLLAAGVPDNVVSLGESIILSDDKQIAAAFPRSGQLLFGHSVIAAQVHHGETSGVRLAWRDIQDPFTQADLEVIECVGSCPPGCC